MAIVPQSGDAFLREVDDEVRRAQVETAARRYGVIAIGLVVAALIAFAGTLFWRSHRDSVAGEQGEQLMSALSDISGGREAQARKTLDALAANGSKGYAPLANITKADILVKDGKDAEATAAFLKIANDSAVPQPIRDLALIRATGLDFDKTQPQAIIGRLKPLAVPGNAWYGTAGEMTALAYIKLNQPKQAGPLLASLAKDKNVPESIRARASQLAGDLGFDPVQPADSAKP